MLCDFDPAATGPREVDLVPTAVGRLRFGFPPQAQHDLVDSYGFDVTGWSGWSGWSALRRLRELKLVTSALPVLAGQPATAARWRPRMRSLRDGDDHSWQPYAWTAPLRTRPTARCPA